MMIGETWSRETVPEVMKIVSSTLSHSDLISLLLVSPFLNRTLASYSSLWTVIDLREMTKAGERLAAALSLVYKQQFSNIAVLGKMEKHYFEGVQEFKGELFGICNLFRDLSDKLFTSEIIELHERHGQGCKETSSNKHESTEIATSSKEASIASSSGALTLNSWQVDTATDREPLLEDMGILYAHRNEDVVNYRGPGIEQVMEVEYDNQIRQQLSIPSMLRKQDIIRGGKENVLSQREEKKMQYNWLAKFTGMEVIEFSKWMLSATPSEREKVIRRYNKRKKKIPKW